MADLEAATSDTWSWARVNAPASRAPGDIAWLLGRLTAAALR
jgi:hypothetical protein